MMKILFVNRFLPHKNVRDSGGLDTYRYMEALSQHHDVSAICFVRPHESHPLEEMRHNFYIDAVPFDDERWLGRVQRLIQRLIFSKVYGRTLSLPYAHHLHQTLKKISPDICIIDGPMGLYHPLINTPKILDAVDLYTNVTHDRHQTTPSLRLWLDHQETAVWERSVMAHCDAILVRSRKDQNTLSQQVSKPIHILPPWFEGLEELLHIPATRPPHNQILFVGAMQNPKNESAVLWFAHNVLPLIQQKIPDATFTIVGANPTPAIRTLQTNPTITVTGEVPTLTPYYTQSAINIAPLTVSGGIIVKTLNGLASARPTVATPAGNSGTGAHPDQHLIVTPHDPSQFAHHITHLLLSETDWLTLATNGRAFITQNYNWHSITTNLSHFLTKIAQKSPH